MKEVEKVDEVQFVSSLRENDRESQDIQEATPGQTLPGLRTRHSVEVGISRWSSSPPIGRRPLQSVFGGREGRPVLLFRVCRDDGTEGEPVHCHVLLSPFSDTSLLSFVCLPFLPCYVTLTDGGDERSVHRSEDRGFSSTVWREEKRKERRGTDEDRCGTLPVSSLGVPKWEN